MTDDAKAGAESKADQGSAPAPTPSTASPKPRAAKPRKPATAVRTVWVVVKGEGLKRMPSDRARKQVEADKARRANDIDLSMAGVTGNPGEEA